MNNFLLLLEALDLNSSNNTYTSSPYEDLDLLMLFFIASHQKSPIIYNKIKSNHWYEAILFNYDNIRFRKTLRVNQSTFWNIVNKIHNHEIFLSQPRQQASIEKQLAVVLYRLGGKTTIWDICSKFGIAEGTVQLFTSRIIVALKSLKSQVIIWPRNDYHQEVHKGFEEKYGFPNIIGALDGSHMNLFEAPSKPNKDVYFTRKRRYAIHLQAIVDHKG